MIKTYTGDNDQRCPLMNGQLCRKVCPTCRFQVDLIGKDPNTGVEVRGWDCVLDWQHKFAMDTTAAVHGLGAAIESFRNEVVAGRGDLLNGSVKLAEHVINGAYRAVQRIEHDGDGS
jgi:hypothetical protein